MKMVKRVIIFLLVAIGIFSTVEFINFKLEAADNYGLNTASISGPNAKVSQTASTKSYSAQKHKEIKAKARALAG